MNSASLKTTKQSERSYPVYAELRYHSDPTLSLQLWPLLQTLREQEEKRLAEKKRQEEERLKREAEEKKQREQEEKLRRLEEIERRKQLMMQAQKVI